MNDLRADEPFRLAIEAAPIAGRKRAERERDRLRAELQALNAQLEERVEARTAELVATLKERDVLLQEVHHRVKNNLQVISSLIGMQGRSMGDPGSREALVECQTRVRAIAIIHEQLHRSRGHERVPFAEYARSLVGNVFAAAGEPSGKVSLQLSVEDVALTVDTAIPCGLILNELISNALKHAFRDGGCGTIRVELGRTGSGGLRLLVADDGAGTPPGFDITRCESLGLQLVRMLAKQLDAELRVETGGGTCFRLTIPVGQ